MVQILPWGPTSSNRHHRSLEDICNRLSQHPNFCSLSSYWVSLGWDPGEKTIPWSPLAHCGGAFWQASPGVSRALDEQRPCWTSERGNGWLAGWRRLNANWWDAPGSIDRRVGGADAHSILCSALVNAHFPAQGTARLHKESMPCGQSAWRHPPRPRKMSLPLFPNATRVWLFHNCDRMDYSFPHRNICHCQHQKLPCFGSGSTCLIDQVPSEQLTHEKQLNLSDFKSKVRQATASSTAHT